MHTLADVQRPGPSRPPARQPAGTRIFTLADLPPSDGRCAGCHSPDGELYEALGKVWHHDCLLCAKCQRPAGARLYQVPGWDEVVYCHNCTSRRQDRCIGCNRPSNSSRHLEEGRCLCSECAVTATLTAQQAQAEYARVQR